MSISEKGYDLDMLLEATLEEAPKIYRSREGSRVRWLYPKDDFIQEALMHILRLYDEDYIPALDESKGTLNNLVSSLLSGTFILNKYTLGERDKYREALRLDEVVYNRDGIDKENILDSITSSELEPDTEWELVLGQELLKTLMENVLDMTPPQTFKHKYLGESVEYGSFELTEYNLILHKLLGYTLKEVVDLFGVDTMSKENYIRRISKRAETKLVEALKLIDIDNRNIIIKYLETI